MKILNLFVSVVVSVSLPVVIAFAATLPPPEYQLVDPNHVNMATGQVSPSLTDLSIGGERGLTHSISADGSELVNYEQSHWGPRDSFNGGLVSGRVYFNSPEHIRGVNDLTLPTLTSFRGLTSYLGQSATVFYINGDGTYTAEKDERHTLIYENKLGAYVHTHPDGTRVIFKRGNKISASHNRKALHKKIDKVIYPNGLTHYFDWSELSGDSVGSVTTNTGYQLKYIYEERSASLHSSLQQKLDRIKSARNGTFDAEVNHSTWTRQTPKKVIGINNRDEVCDGSSPNCLLDGSWPTAEYFWPDGMPAAMYLGENDFKVKDASGRETIYTHRPHDRSSGHVGDLPTGLHFTTRLYSIKEGHQSKPSRVYEYQNLGTKSCTYFACATDWSPTQIGVLKNVRQGDENHGYSPSVSTPFDIINGGGAYRGIKYVKKTIDHGRIFSIVTWNQTISLERDQSNRVNRVYDAATGVSTRHEEWVRNNVTRHRIVGKGEEKFVTATYPKACTNRKTCNQATSITDAMGHTTDYRYHEESGQVEAVTQPAPREGLPRPQIRYHYEQKYAYFKSEDGVMERAETPIWLLVEESYCINGAPNSYTDIDIKGCALGASDEVITRYEYDDSASGSNLQLIGVLIEAYNASEQKELRRTCYSYNQYGQKIGETLPNANLSSCREL